MRLVYQSQLGGQQIGGHGFVCSNLGPLSVTPALITLASKGNVFADLAEGLRSKTDIIKLFQ